MATGAENARANPFADCTTDTAMPRLRTKYRDSSGTNTTSPRQFAPSVITTPYSTTICHSCVAQRICQQAGGQQCPAHQDQPARAQTVHQPADQRRTRPVDDLRDRIGQRDLGAAPAERVDEGHQEDGVGVHEARTDREGAEGGGEQQPEAGAGERFQVSHDGSVSGAAALPSPWRRGRLLQTRETGATAAELIHSHSQWGPADQIGAGNLLTVEKRLAALASVRQGRIYDVSHEIYMGAPYMAPNQTPFLMSIFGSWRDTIKRRRKMGATNDAGTNLERIEMTAHVGTHIDALGHFSNGDMLYNGNAAADVVTDWGLDRLGIEHAPPMITRAVLFDVAGPPCRPGRRSRRTI